MKLPQSISFLLRDPPPSLVFELSEAGIAVARIGKSTEVDFRPLAEGVISISPLRDNILMPEELASAVRNLAPSNGNRKRRDVALILPDNCARLSVLDFDSFPKDPKEQLSLIRFRVKKTIPFDAESAAISFWPQLRKAEKKLGVVVAIAPLEIVARYEAPFRAAGLNPGLVTTSTLAVLPLVEGTAVTVLAKLAGRVLTVSVLERGVLQLIRCLELSEASISEVAADLFPTFVFIEDTLGGKAERLLLCGFGPAMEEARRQFQAELEIAVEPLRSPLGAPGENNAGLLGYLKGATES